MPPAEDDFSSFCWWWWQIFLLVKSVFKNTQLEDWETEQPGTQTGTYFSLHKYMSHVD